MINTMIFTEVHLLAGKLLLVVAIHSLGGSRANWHFFIDVAIEKCTLNIHLIELDVVGTSIG